MFRVIEDPYAGVDLTDNLLRVGVDILSISVGEVSLCLSRPKVSFAGLRGREVCLLNIFELVVEVGNV